MMRITSKLLIIATVILSIGAANAQSLVEFAIGTPDLAKRTIAVDRLEQAEVAIYNNCEWPVDAKILVTPYAPDGATNPDYDPKSITRTLPAKGFSFIPLDLLPTADNIAYADIAIGPAFTQGPSNSCNPPALKKIITHVVVWPKDGGAPREVIPVKWIGPSFKSDDTSTNAGGIAGPNTIDSFLAPVSKGDKVHIPIENSCADVRGGTLILTYTGGDGNDVVLSEDLAPGERKILSLTIDTEGATDSFGQQWIYFSREADGGKACSDAIKVAFIYKTAISRF